MKFIESQLCLSREHCPVCRHRMKGAQWRKLVGRIYPTDGPNFECPLGLPWLEGEPTTEQLLPFQNLEPKAPRIETLAQVSAKKQRFPARKLGELFHANQLELRRHLPRESAVIQALDALAEAEANPRGCRGCRRKRFIRRLGNAMNACSPEVQERVKEIVKYDW